MGPIQVGKQVSIRESLSGGFNMKQIIAILLFSIGIANAQQTSTIFQQVISGNEPCVGSSCTGTILPLPYASVNMNAIGQANHAMSITLTNAPAKTCLGGVVDIGMEYSFDTVTYTRFGDQLTTIALNADSQYTTVANAYGAYPYVRLKVRGFDSTNCILTAAYSGVVAGQATITLTAGAVTVTNAVTTIPTGVTTSYDSGLVTVPNALTVVTAGVTTVNNIWCNNLTASSVNLSITDTAGNYIVGSGTVPFVFPASSNGMLFNSAKGLKYTGLKWIAGTAAALNCQVGGYQ